jgi:prevent-host-death family protein
VSFWIGDVDCFLRLNADLGLNAAAAFRLLALIQRDSHNSYMEKATVSKLKNNLSAYLRKVRAGHAVVIYDRDVPIARLERIESSGSGSDRLALLRAQGLTRPPSRSLSPTQLRAALSSALPRGARLLEALQADRDEGR